MLDGSPDNSHQKLKETLPHVDFVSQLILLSRNFGSYAAIPTGLEKAKGQYFAVMIKKIVKLFLSSMCF